MDSSTEMMLDLQPSFAIPAGTYEMVVENADGQQGTLPSALHIAIHPYSQLFRLK